MASVWATPASRSCPGSRGGGCRSRCAWAQGAACYNRAMGELTSATSTFTFPHLWSRRRRGVLRPGGACRQQLRATRSAARAASSRSPSTNRRSTSPPTPSPSRMIEDGCSRVRARGRHVAFFGRTRGRGCLRASFGLGEGRDASDKDGGAQRPGHRGNRDVDHHRLRQQGGNEESSATSAAATDRGSEHGDDRGGRWWISYHRGRWRCRRPVGAVRRPARRKVRST